MTRSEVVRWLREEMDCTASENGPKMLAAAADILEADDKVAELAAALNGVTVEQARADERERIWAALLEWTERLKHETSWDRMNVNLSAMQEAIERVCGPQPSKDGVAVDPKDGR